MSKRGSSRDDPDVPRSETGWLDDLKRAKHEGGDIGDSTTGGSDRWAKLGALSGDPEPRPPAPPAGRRPRGGDPRSAEPPRPTRDSAPPRRARPAPEVETPHSAPDPDRESARETARRLIGRRSRPENNDDRSNAAGLIGRRARSSDPDTSQRGRSDTDYDLGRRTTDPDLDTGSRRRSSDFGDAPSRPSPGGAPGGSAGGEEPRRRSEFLDRLTDRPSTRARPDVPGEPTRGRLDSPAGETSRGRHDLPPADPPAGPAGPRGRMPFARSAGPRPDTSGTRGRHDLPPADEPRGVAPKLSRGPGAAAAPPTGMPGPTKPVGPMPGSPPPGAPKPGPAGSPLPGGVPGPIRPTSPSAAPGARRVGLAAGVQAFRGARSEVRRQLREQQRLRMWTLVLMVVAVVGALPFYFVLRAVSQDPVITSLDALSVPGWAVVNKTDNITGSRWCIMDCRYRERTAESNRPIEETAKVYRAALLGAGWSQMTNVPGCEPVQEQDSDHSCWRRDEFTLDLSVNEPPCMQESLRKRPKIEVTPSTTPSDTQSPDASASPTPTAGADDCLGSVVQIKVFNAIDDVRLRYAPEPSPIDNLTDEDLQTPSPTPTP